MAGLSEARANAALDEALDGASHVQLHDGDPGSAGTSNLWTDDDRESVTFGSATGAEKAITNEPEWDVTDEGTITHVSLWTAASGGSFVASSELVTARSVVDGDKLILRSLVFSMSTA